MAATYTKEALSGSTHGRGILLATSASPGTTIHTAVAGTTSASEDVITLYAYNSNVGAETLVIQWGGTTSPDDDIKLSIPAQAGLVLVTADLILRNALVIKGYSTTANKVTIHGYALRVA
jgi:hypothetical protein